MTTTRHKPRQPRTFARLKIDFRTAESRTEYGATIPRETLSAGDVLETIVDADGFAELATPGGARVQFVRPEFKLATVAEHPHFAWVAFTSQMREIIDLAGQDDEAAQLRIARQIFTDRGANRNFGDMTVREVCAAIRTANAPCFVV